MNTTPIDSLWNISTKAIYNSHQVSEYIAVGNDFKYEIMISILVLSFFILLIIFSKALINIIPILGKSIFNFKKAIEIEERLSLSVQRDNVALVSIIYLSIATTIIGSDYIYMKSGFNQIFILSGTILLLPIYILIKKLVLKILAYLLKENHLFDYIFKTQYNYIIISAILTIPIIALHFALPELATHSLFKIATYTLMSIFILYLFRISKLFIFYRRSYIFNILYLCSVEILPMGLLIFVLFLL